MAYRPTQGCGFGFRTSEMVLLGSEMTLLATSTWMLNDTGRKADISTAFTGAAAYAGVIGDPTVTITCPADDTLDPEIAGLRFGVIVPYLWLYTIAPTWDPVTGAVLTHGRATLVRNAFCEGPETNSDATADVQRLRITLSGGKTYHDQTPVTPARDPATILP
jgi:hypothetical protein